jgi:hypothetical protein
MSGEFREAFIRGPLSAAETVLVACYYLHKAGADQTDNTILAWIKDPPDVPGREYIKVEVLGEDPVAGIRAAATELALNGDVVNIGDPLIAIETALRFYANPKNWERTASREISRAVEDHGRMAQNALVVIATSGEDQGV